MRFAFALLAVLLIGGCGVPQQLSKQAEEVHSVAAEGALLAHEASEGRRGHVHARARGGIAKSASDKLEPAIQNPRLVQHRREGRRALRQLAERPATVPSRALLERVLDEGREGCRRAGGMKNIFGVALGILAAIGGFVDIGDIVFNVAAGATFGYQLLWAVVVGVGGIITYAEMCGRVAAVSEKAVFDAVRERLGFGVGSRRTRRRRAREPADARGRDRRRCACAPAPLGPLLRVLLVLAVLALGSSSGRCRSSGSSASSATAASRCSCSSSRRSSSTRTGARSRTASSRDRKRERLGLRVLRRRPGRGGDDPVRGLLLLVGRDRGAAGARRISASTAPTRSSATRSAACSPSP